MKTTDAYSLRGWKFHRIFQRPFCATRLQELGIAPTADDDDVFLERFDCSLMDANSDAMTAINEKLAAVKKNVVAPYWKLLNKHHCTLEHLLKKYLKAFADDNGNNKSLSQKLIRIQMLVANYGQALGENGDLQSKIGEILSKNSKVIDDQYRREVGGRIRKARQAKKLSQLELAGATGLSQSMIAQLERGLREASYSSLRRIARLLEMSPGNLL